MRLEEKELPKGWEVKKLEEVCKKISLNGIKIKQKDYLQEGRFPVVDQGQELIGGYFNDEKLVIPNDPPYIIFGDHTKVKKFINFKFIAGADGVKVLKVNSILDPKFFFYLIHTVKIPDKGYARHFQFLEREEILIPPLIEQQTIVAKIEELFSQLENGKQQLLNAQTKLKTYRQSLLKWAFEGKFTNQNLKDGELPKGWEVIVLGKACDKISLNGIKIKQKDYLQKGVFPVVDQGQEIIGGYFNDEKLLVPSEPPYIIFGDHTKVKKFINFKFVAGADGVKVLKPHSIYDPKFFYYLIHTVKIPDKGYARHFQFLEKKEIPLPPLSEQQAIVATLESKLTICDKIEETITASLKQSEMLRQSILKKAFEGQLVAPKIQESLESITKIKN